MAESGTEPISVSDYLLPIPRVLSVALPPTDLQIQALAAISKETSLSSADKG